MNDFDYRAIGLRIRKRREFLGIRRQSFAKMLGITPTFLADIELGNKGFSLKRLNQICQLLRMSSEALLYGDSHPGKAYASIWEMLEQCPEDKRRYAVEMLAMFLMSHDEA
ncbi:MAG: helix-turn-helix transcriptional regulator [Eubacterium sp.]|nr:helix-turn-helix transcriptional regulator [Eubacterium sp.]